MVVQSTRFIDRKLNDFLCAWRETNIAGNSAITAANDELNGAANFVQLDAEITEHFRRDTFALAYESEQQVLRSDVVVVEALRLLLRKLQDFPRPLGEFIEAVCHLTFTPSLKRNQNTHNTEQLAHCSNVRTTTSTTAGL